MTEGILTGSGTIKRIVVAYIPPETDLVRGIEEVVKREGITSGIILGGAASLRRVTLCNCRNFKEALPLNDNYRVYSTTDGPYELVGITGNIATTEDGALSIHMHATVSSGEPAGRTYGGHLLAGETYTLGEIAIAEVEGVTFKRLVDPVTRTPHLVPEQALVEGGSGA